MRADKGGTHSYDGTGRSAEKTKLEKVVLAYVKDHPNEKVENIARACYCGRTMVSRILIKHGMRRRHRSPTVYPKPTIATRKKRGPFVPTPTEPGEPEYLCVLQPETLNRFRNWKGNLESQKEQLLQMIQKLEV